MKSCAIEGCERKHHARGWCHTHYEHWLKYGTPLAVGRSKFINVRLNFRQPMDEWDERMVRRLLAQRMSYRAIQRATGIGYNTVARFVRRERANGVL